MKKKNPVVHFELPADDRKKLADFYSGVFGWNTNFLGEDMGNYVMLSTAATDENNMIMQSGAINAYSCDFGHSVLTKADTQS
jgi:uncharacterized protein